MSADPAEVEGAGSAAGEPSLELHLETELPAELPAGKGTALFLFGSCFHRHHALEGLAVLLDGKRHVVEAFAMPRLDLFRSLHPNVPEEELPSIERDPASTEDPELRCYRSGFWTTVPVTPRERPGMIELRVEATLTGGGSASAELGEIEVVDAPAPRGSARRAKHGRIAICMATFEPDLALFRVQLNSIREQSDRDWVCVISDDCSHPDHFERLLAEVEGDERFIVSRSDRHLGFYRNFERALELAPAEADLVALCDQDDRWYPDKLASLRGALGRAQLVYSDQRLVDPEGGLVADTYWTARRNNHRNFASLLIANTITGAASLIRRDVVDLALPFPEAPGEQYHDHWLGLVAMVTGRVNYVDRPLYDYVQHCSAVLGHTQANIGVPEAGRSIWRRRVSPGHWRREIADWRGAYFNGYERLVYLAEVLLARCGDRLPAGRRRTLRRFIAAEHSPVAFAWLAARLLRRTVGLTETLRVERLLIKGILWRHLIALRASGMERPRGFYHDASLPPSGLNDPEPAHGNAATTHIQWMLRPLELSISESAPERLNLMIPTIDLRHLFGGYIAKFNLARRLAEAGLRVRIVTVDPTPSLPRSWKHQVESYSGLEGTFENVEVAFAREGDRPLEISPTDRFIATTWWTAYLTHQAVGKTERSRFLYLIQEYEPFTFVMGSWAAVAASTYKLPHLALFSTELLRTFFAERSYGVFGPGGEQGERDSLAFRNAITAVDPPSAEVLASRQSRRLLFYARPEPHAARNMFELGLLSLSTAVEQGVFGPEWEFFGIGSVGGEDRIQLSESTHLELIPRQRQDDYRAMLGRHDVGLALMYTPHPSLVPIEMASAGMLTVTNTFETKTADELGAISSNLVAVDPSPHGVIDGLRRAAAGVEDHTARAAGAALDWPRDWDRSFDEETMRRILGLLSRL